MENPDNNIDDVPSVVRRQGENDAVTMRKKQICKEEICPDVAINVSSHGKAREQGPN